MGKELGRQLGVIVGDVIFIISPRGMLSPAGHMPTMSRFKVIGFFESGMYEYDGSLAYIHLAEAQKMLRIPEAVSGIEVRLNDIYHAKKSPKRLMVTLAFLTGPGPGCR